MKKILTIFSLAIFTMSLAMASSGYTLDNNQVDKLFDGAIEVSLNDIASNPANLPTELTMISQDDLTTKVLVAWIVCWTGLSGFGVHRYVLGTKPNMWAIYTFTVCGIFGIVPFIDWVVLLVDGLINQNGQKYIDNEEFFMWG